MARRRSIRMALLAMTLGAVCLMDSVVLAGTTQAAVTGSVRASVGTSAIPKDVLQAADELSAKRGAVSTASTLAFTRAKVGANLPPLPPGPSVITCTMQAHYPHQSIGTPSAVDGKVTSECTAPVRDIRAQAELHRYLDGYGFVLVGIGSLGYKFNSKGPVTSMGLDICQGRPTYYMTMGIHSYVAPPGYYPPSDSFTTETPAILVNC